MHFERRLNNETVLISMKQTSKLTRLVKTCLAMREFFKSKYVNEDSLKNAIHGKESWQGFKIISWRDNHKAYPRIIWNWTPTVLLLRSSILRNIFTKTVRKSAYENKNLKHLRFLQSSMRKTVYWRTTMSTWLDIRQQLCKNMKLIISKMKFGVMCPWNWLRHLKTWFNIGRR